MGKYGWKDLAGTAKKWLEQKTTETVTADRHTRRDSAANAEQLERTMSEQAGGAVLTTLFPGLGRAMERQEQRAREAEARHVSDARAKRVAAVVAGSWIELDGEMRGRVEDLAVTIEPDDEAGTLVIRVEAVDSVTVQGGEFVAASFAIVGFRGAGTYPLVSEHDALEPGINQVVSTWAHLPDEYRTFYWVEDYGPASATAGEGVIEARFECQDEGSDHVRATVHVPMP